MTAKKKTKELIIICLIFVSKKVREKLQRKVHRRDILDVSFTKNIEEEA